MLLSRRLYDRQARSLPCTDHIQHDPCPARTTFSTIPVLQGPHSARRYHGVYTSQARYLPYKEHIQHDVIITEAIQQPGTIPALQRLHPARRCCHGGYISHARYLSFKDHIQHTVISLTRTTFSTMLSPLQRPHSARSLSFKDHLSTMLLSRRLYNRQARYLGRTIFRTMLLSRRLHNTGPIPVL
jgi:hypothetical protein